VASSWGARRNWGERGDPSLLLLGENPAWLRACVSLERDGTTESDSEMEGERLRGTGCM
jgi:hypothetical protein